jgi:diguanylate cyclase (GGDEF)-like protein
MAVGSSCSLLFIAAVLLTGETITSRLIAQILFLVVFAAYIGLLSGKISKYNMNMATLDQLTTLYNRRYFMNEAKHNLVLSKESDFTIYLVVIDVDYFKEINDRLGHLEGDKILHNIGVILRNSIREGDLAARYGGDEFVLLLTGMDSADILPFCESLEHTIQSQLSGVSVSTGYAAYPADGEQIEDLFHSADMAMYQRKQLKKTQKEEKSL